MKCSYFPIMSIISFIWSTSKNDIPVISILMQHIYCIFSIKVTMVFKYKETKVIKECMFTFIDASFFDFW